MLTEAEKRVVIILVSLSVVFSVALLLLLLAAPSYGQVTCFRYSNNLSCDGPGTTNRTITEFSPGMGVITDERGRVEPYTVLPPRQERRRALDDVLRPLPRTETPRAERFRERTILDRSVLDRSVLDLGDDD